MHALIMAGGSGSRLNLGEKPLILIGGRPMISYVIAAFSVAGFEPVVAVSPNTPMTMNWCRANGIAVFKADGCGYIEDMISVVRMIDERHPLFISVADIPCVTPDIIRTIARAYYLSGKDGCSTWVPAGRVSSCREGMPYRKMVNGMEACPAGINILLGDLIDQSQDELQLLLDEPGLSLNVNTPADRIRAENFLKRQTL
jgi:adenosylcobinamide-phosphate guanylyltransferase